MTAVLEAPVEAVHQVVVADEAGDALVPPDLLGTVMTRVGTVGGSRHQDPAGPGRTLGGLTQRELRVLRLLADGCTTREIAGELCYSERTIKNAIQALTARLQLRNRSHAVAYALRHGLI